MSVEYVAPFAWIRSNLKEPAPTLLFVAAVSLGVGAKNLLSDNKHDVFIEPLPEQAVLASHTEIVLPRVCIVKRGDPIEKWVAILREKVVE